MTLTRKYVPSTVILLGILVVTSAFTLWIVDAWIKYPLFVFEIFSIIVTYLVSTNREISFHNFRVVNRILLHRNYLGPIADATIIALASSLVFLNWSHSTNGNMWQLVSAFICASFLSGYILLHLFRITKYFSNLEVFFLSYLVSFIFSGFVSLALLPIEENTRTIVMPLVYVAIGIISIVERRKSGGSRERPSEKSPHSFSKKIDFIAILVGIIFYVMFFSIIYPNASLLSGTDISRHYSASIILSRSPDLYSFSRFSYVLFHGFEASILNLSGLNQSVSNVASIMVTLNLFLPLSIYIFAKRYLSNIDKRIPAISVIMYSIFSNFSYIYYTQLKILGTSSSQIQYLVADRSYNGIIYFLQPFTFLVPLSVSTVLFVAAFFLLKAANIPKSIFVTLFTAVLFSMYLTHVPEAIVFAIFLALYSFVSRTKTLRLDDALLASFISFVLAGLTFALTSFVWVSEIRGTSINFIGVLSFLFPILLIGSTIIWRKKIYFKIHFPILKNVSFSAEPKFYNLLTLILVTIYLLGFLTWFFIGDFRTSSVIGLGSVPWFIYPLLLGTVGLLAILSIRYIGDIPHNTPLIFLLTASGFMFLFGRVLSFISLNIIIADYWEKRFALLIFIFVCILAPIPLLNLIDRLQSSTRNKNVFSLSKFIPQMVLICIIVFSGYSSMALQVEYWYSTSARAKTSGSELEAVNFLREILQNDTHAYVIAPSTISRGVLAFAAPAYQFSRPELLLSSQYPDIPLLALNAHNLKHAYLYMHARDFAILDKEPTSWIKQHLLPMLPIIFSNSQVTIYNTTSVSFPVSNSDTTLIVPATAQDNSWIYAYDVLSQSGKNWTVAYDKDANYFKSHTIVLGFDPAKYSIFQDHFSSNTSHRWNIVKGNWSFSTHGLQVKDDSDSIHNIALSPMIFSPVNLNITTSFKMLETYPNVASYVSIIYSWTDPKNFEYAGITVRSNIIYLSFAKVKNGELSFDPTWPGVRTNLQWNKGNTVNMTLSINKNLQHLYLNGVEYINRVSPEGAPGYVGLSYGRAKNIIFSNFGMQGVNDGIQSSPSDFLQYIRQGGHLVVFNTNGYGSIFSSWINTSSANDAKNKNITIKDLNLVSRNSQSEETSSILQSEVKNQSTFFHSMTKNIGRGKLTYVNIYPILSSFFDNKISGSKIYQILSKISQVMDLNPVKSPINFNDISAIFRKVSTNAIDIHINTTGLVFPSGHFDNIGITTGNNQIIVTNTEDLSIQGFDHALVSTESNNSVLSMTGGRGLYANLNLGNGRNDNQSNNILHISFLKHANLTTMTSSGQEKIRKFYNVSDLQLTNKQPVTILARQPIIKIIHGNTTFKELYSPQQLYGKTGVSGQDLRVSGNVTMSVFMNDAYTLLNMIGIKGSAERIPPLSKYNDLVSFLSYVSLSKVYALPPLVRVLSLVPFLIAAIFIIYSPKYKPHTIKPD